MDAFDMIVFFLLGTLSGAYVLLSSPAPCVLFLLWFLQTEKSPPLSQRPGVIALIAIMAACWLALTAWDLYLLHEWGLRWCVQLVLYSIGLGLLMATVLFPFMLLIRWLGAKD